MWLSLLLLSLLYSSPVFFFPSSLCLLFPFMGLQFFKYSSTLEPLKRNWGKSEQWIEKKTSNDNKNVLGANQVFNYIMFSLYSVLMVIQFHYCGIYLKFHYVCSCLPTFILRTWVVFKVYRLVISKISNHQGYNYPGNFSHLLTDSELWGRRETLGTPQQEPSKVNYHLPLKAERH